MRALMWFRSDLRTADNTALHCAASMASRGVVGVFVVSAEQWAEHDWGANKMDFVLRSVAALSPSLAELNIPLRVLTVPRFADVPGTLAGLAERCDCSTLFFNLEYEVNERKRDAAVKEACKHAGIAVHAFHDQTVVPPDGLRTSDGGFYTVFTPFKRKWRKLVGAHPSVDVLARPSKQPRIDDIVSDGVPDVIGGVDLARAVAREHWPAGEGEAYRRLERFVRRIDGYARNRDVPALAGTSMLSPYLACGAISARTCLAAALAADGGPIGADRQDATAWIDELVWREFYRHVLVGFPRVGMRQPFKLDRREVEWNTDEEAFRRWCEGRTGVPIVDAGMRQLAETGWMHNRLRMIVAMYLTKDLLIDWRKGEAFFMSQLVDGDLANNNGGWQWSASTGADAAPYFRIFNPYTQGRRCDPDGAFVRRFVPELSAVHADDLHAPEEWPPLLRRTLDYPEPLVVHKVARQRALAAFNRTP